MMVSATGFEFRCSIMMALKLKFRVIAKDLKPSEYAVIFIVKLWIDVSFKTDVSRRSTVLIGSVLSRIISSLMYSYCLSTA